MNKKGFTLIELLSVIVLIGILSTIGVLSYNSIRKSILDKEYSSVISKIEIAAESYYQDTESLSFYVQTLIDEGYIKADDNKGFIYDPRNKNNINCYLININDNGDAKVEENDKCNNDILENYDLSIVLSNGNKVPSSWYNRNLTLKVKNNANISGNINYTWTTDLNPNIVNTTEQFNLSNMLLERGNVINDTFYVSGSINNKTYKSGPTKVKIDLVKPSIESISKEGKDDANIWYKERKITAKVSDKGSGIINYSFVYSKENISSSPCTNAKYTKIKNTFLSSLEYVATENGYYYLCIKDEAGNINDFDSGNIIEIKNIDKNPPKCYYDGESTSWASLRTIKFGCQDEESGCNKIIYNNKTYSCNGNKICTNSQLYKNYNTTTMESNIKNNIGSFTIIDNNNNKTTCPASDKSSLNIYVDKTSPSVQIKSLSYNGTTLTVNAYVYDSNSGIQTASVSYNNKVSYNNCNGNCTFTINTSLSNRNLPVTLTAKDNVGNSNSTSKTIYVYSGNVNDEQNYYGIVRKNHYFSGTYLYKTYNSSLGSNLFCDEAGNCSIYPQESTKECLLDKDPSYKNLYYESCDGRGRLNYYGVCTASNQSYTNSSGYCEYNSGNYADNHFRYNSSCEDEFGKRYETLSVSYTCSDCTSYNPGTYYNFTELCIAISNAPKFGNFSGTKSVKAYKECYYQSYIPDSYCEYGYTEKDGGCYACDVGDLDTTNLKCMYMGRCTTYKYQYSYTYYSYS